ncbi:c-type cytochrome [Ghiorsea bivora]|uniref:c-type cytochrome n=1 Tax=Ghiorsea bivora TaxID=1485545 RepID=UPI00057092C9|nr:c-type cytochrome [Ghiorsea bivora]
MRLHSWRFYLRVMVLLLLPNMSWAASEQVVRSIASTDSAYPKLNMEQAKHSLKQIQHGEYLLKMGDCFTCHTDEANDGKPFAGGLKIATPFGDLYAPNITPDKETGIGKWSDKQFVQAVREGIAPDGSYYYPVFPYNYFHKMSEQDVLDIKAYLDVVPAVHQENHAQEMDWPFNYRFLQLGWRLLYFTFEDDGFEPDATHSKAWNRGKFIVEGPGHCALCHTQLNYFGVPKKDYYLAGTFVEGYYAPNIAAQGLKNLSKYQVVDIFKKNEMPTHGELSGPMRGVEHNSLRFLTDTDLLAIATYLKTIQSKVPSVEVDMGKDFTLQDGKKLYESSCAMCHDDGLMGAPRLEKHIWLVLLDQGRKKLHEVTIRGNGDMPAKGGCDECSNGRLKAAVDYMIQQALEEK